MWWQFDRWEREIDWMALNGINLALAYTGQEYVYRKVGWLRGVTLPLVFALGRRSSLHIPPSRFTVPWA